LKQQLADAEEKKTIDPDNPAAKKELKAHLAANAPPIDMTAIE